MLKTVRNLFLLSFALVAPKAYALIGGADVYQASNGVNVYLLKDLHLLHYFGVGGQQEFAQEQSFLDAVGKCNPADTAVLAEDTWSAPEQITQQLPNDWKGCCHQHKSTLMQGAVEGCRKRGIECAKSIECRNRISAVFNTCTRVDKLIQSGATQQEINALKNAQRAAKQNPTTLLQELDAVIGSIKQSPSSSALSAHCARRAECVRQEVGEMLCAQGRENLDIHSALSELTPDVLRCSLLRERMIFWLCELVDMRILQGIEWAQSQGKKKIIVLSGALHASLVGKQLASAGWKQIAKLGDPNHAIDRLVEDGSVIKETDVRRLFDSSDDIQDIVEVSQRRDTYMRSGLLQDAKPVDGYVWGLLAHDNPVAYLSTIEHMRTGVLLLLFMLAIFIGTMVAFLAPWRSRRIARGVNRREWRCV